MPGRPSACGAGGFRDSLSVLLLAVPSPNERSGCPGSPRHLLVLRRGIKQALVVCEALLPCCLASSQAGPNGLLEPAHPMIRHAGGRRSDVPRRPKLEDVERFLWRDTVGVIRLGWEDTLGRYLWRDTFGGRRRGVPERRLAAARRA